MHILLIDEDETFREKIAGLTGKFSAILDYANSFAKAQSCLKASKYEFILVEPYWNNSFDLKVIEKLKLITTIPIIVTTREPSISTAIVAIKLGADNYFCKASDIHGSLEPYLKKDLSMDAGNPAEKPIPIETLRWEHMRNVLQDMKGNISAAARILGVNRRTLHRKINQYMHSNQSTYHPCDPR